MADFHISYKVCKCKKVTLGQIKDSILIEGAKTVEDVCNITKAGTACGCCKSKKDDFGDPKLELYIEDILKKYID